MLVMSTSVKMHNMRAQHACTTCILHADVATNERDKLDQGHESSPSATQPIVVDNWCEFEIMLHPLFVFKKCHLPLNSKHRAVMLSTHAI